MANCLLLLGFLFYLVGIVQFLNPPRRQKSVSVPQARHNDLEERLQALAAQQKASTPPAITPLNLDWIKIGSPLQIKHPQKDALNLKAVGQIIYQEYWQHQGSWQPSGSTFTAFMLDNQSLLLNWQNRYYLLDESKPLSENEIKRDFMPHARKFGQSDQTAEVHFSYPPAVWRIDDIGRFKIASITGDGFSQQIGANGRFIHASGDSRRALVLEDYQDGRGGQDMLWTGWQLEENDIQAA